MVNNSQEIKSKKEVSENTLTLRYPNNNAQNMCNTQDGAKFLMKTMKVVLVCIIEIDARGPMTGIWLWNHIPKDLLIRSFRS